MRGNSLAAAFISESGLYSLILQSKKPEAKAFKRWVTSEVLPSIRKTRCYSAPQTEEPQPQPEPSRIQDLQLFDLQKIKADNSFNLCTETELHIKVVAYIRKYHPEAVMMAGLGELQQTV